MTLGQGSPRVSHPIATGVGRRLREEGAGADPDELEAAVPVGEDVQQTLVVTSPELGLLVGHAEQVGVQLWEGGTEQLRLGPAAALLPWGAGEGSPAAAAGRCWPGGQTPRACGPRCPR